MDETLFIAKHKTEVLKRLENAKRICVDPLKQDGSERKSGSFPKGAMVEFI